MRKSPTIKDRICNGCGATYKPTGTAQLYCPSCRTANHHIAQKKYEQKKYPNRKPKAKCTEPCCVCGGEFSSHVYGKPYCNKHYQSMIRYGHPYGQKRKSTNTFTVIGNELSIATKSGGKILADAKDIELLRKYSWCISKTGYAVANINGKVTKMHRLIMGVTSDKLVVDHINGNTFDNRKANLRVCTQKDNSRNCKSKHGIRLTPFGKYHARIFVNGEEKYIGSFDTYEEAFQARKMAETKWFGEYGYINSQELNK